MSDATYPSLLFPQYTECITIDGQTLYVPKTVITFKKWAGLPIANTFGNKPLIDFDGLPIFPELAIMKLIKISGWQARWIETYGANAMSPYHFSNWADVKLAEQPVDLIQDQKVADVLHGIATLNGNTSQVVGM
jgi:hypothetical protein